MKQMMKLVKAIPKKCVCALNSCKAQICLETQLNAEVTKSKNAQTPMKSVKVAY